jgi:hypothetical protein
MHTEHEQSVERGRLVSQTDAGLFGKSLAGDVQQSFVQSVPSFSVVHGGKCGDEVVDEISVRFFPVVGAQDR